MVKFTFGLRVTILPIKKKKTPFHFTGLERVFERYLEAN